MPRKFSFLFTFLLALFIFPLHIPGYATYSPECYQNITISSGSVTYGVGINDRNHPACNSIDTGDLGFQIPTLADILTFAIRAFFVIAGLVALFYLLLGALGWVTSGGDKDAVTAAREKIQAAVVGMILIVAVLAIIWTLEQVIFKRRICLGLSCALTLPGLIETTGDVQNIGTPQGIVPAMSSSQANCCICPDQDGNPKKAINSFLFRCKPDGTGEPL